MAGSPQFGKLRGADGQQSRVQDNVAGQLAPIAAAIAQTPMLNGQLPQWVSPDLQGDFANLTGYGTTGFHKDAFAYVHGKGVVSSAGGVGALTNIYRLPLGARPAQNLVFAVANGAGATALSVGADGWVATLRAIAAGAAFSLCFDFLADG